MTLKMEIDALGRSCLLALALGCSGISAAAAAPAQTQEPPQPVWRTDVAGSRIEKAPLIGLVPGGQARSVRLSGLSRMQFFDFGVRADEVVSRASLDLAFTVSASVLPQVSQLNFLVNGVLQQSVNLTKEMIGTPAKLSVPLNPKALNSRNQISIEFIGHIKSVCENPTDESLWLDISNESTLVLEKSSIRLANDMTKLPLPFVDTNTMEATKLPFVFPEAPDARTKEAAAILASWTGCMTNWRGADFPVFYNALPGPQHFVVFATNDKRPNFLAGFPKVEGPQVSIADAPGSLSAKMLVIAGRDEADLLTAAKALVREGNVMIGDVFRPGALKEAPAREAYDAPNWVPVGKTVPFSKLMEYPGQLTSRGYSMPPVQLPVRLPPDLYMTGNANLILNVRYRSTKPMTGETAQFRAFLNGSLIDSDPMAAKDGRGERVIALPGFYGAITDNPAGSLALMTQNVLAFAVDYERIAEGGSPENCKSIMILPHQMEVEPTSTIRLEGLWHQARMPNLKLFFQSGYPFTKFADLSQTAVLISDGASADEVSTMLNAVGRLSAVTGGVADKVRVVSSANDPAASERDILAIGRVVTRMSDINAENAADLQAHVEEAIRARKPGDVFPAPEAKVLAEPVAAVVGLESPLKSGRSVVALLSEGPASSLELNSRLVKPGDLNNVGGTVAVVSPGNVAEFSVGDRYVVGDLPWYHRVWMRLSRHPGWLVVCALVSALVIGFAAFVFMRRWVGRRA